MFVVDNESCRDGRVPRVGTRCGGVGCVCAGSPESV